VERRDNWLERSGSGTLQAGTSKFVAPACVDEGPFGWPPRASIERTDHMPVI
jgi:hypothetical protein